MGPQEATLDRLLGRVEAEFGSVEFRRRQSFLMQVRAILAAGRPRFTR